MGEMKSMMVKVGWKKDFIEKNTPVLPISGWMGDNLLKKSTNMDWWKGMDVAVGKENLHVETLFDVLNEVCRIPERPISAPMRMPISGIYKIKGVGEFDAQIQVLDIPNEIKVGYSPIGFVRCGRAACRTSALKWKMGKETGGKKMEEPHCLKSNEMAQVVFEPQQPLVADSFKNCEGLSRVAFMDGNGVVMLGKVVTVEAKVFEAKKK